MPPRQMNDLRTVTNIVAESGGADYSSAINAISKVGSQIVEQSNESRLLEASSAAQLELGKISTEHKLKYESDPFNEKGMQEYKAATNAVLQKYGAALNPLSKRDWLNTSTKLTAQADIDNQTWQYKQAAVNTKNSVIKSTQNYLNQASLDGEQFGQSDETAIASFMNYQSAQEELTKFGSKYLGEETSKRLMDDFSQDWTKSFISGVAKQNPVKALQMLDHEQVKSSITNQEDFMKFRDAVEAKALNFQNEAVQREVLDNMMSENELFNSNRVLSYAELRQVTANMSEPAQKYFLQKSGYVSPEAVKLSAEEKITSAASLFSEVGRLTNQEDGVTAQEVQGLQQRIFQEMNRGAITKEQGQFFMESLVGPYTEKLAGNLDQYSGNDLIPFNNDVGFEQVQQYFRDNIAIDETELKGAEKKFAEYTNANNGFSFYQQYYDSLNNELASIRNPSYPKGMTINDIGALSRKERNDVYARAQKDAIDAVSADSTVKRKTVSNIPMADIKLLREKPELAPKFDEVYGTGAANRVLGK